MNVEANSIEELIERSGDHKEALQALGALVSAAVPRLERTLVAKPSITMIGYGDMPSPSASAAEDDRWPIIGIAPQKATVNLYIAGEEAGVPLLEVYKGRLGKVSVGKSCARIRRIETVDTAGIVDLVKAAEVWAIAQGHVG